MNPAILTMLGVFALDQTTKYLVSSGLRLGQSWPAEGWVRVTYGTNSGSAFGFFPDQTVLLTVASVIAIGVMVYFYRTQALPNSLLRLGLGLLLGGAFGNLIDRVRLGSVVDFIDIGRWPLFNVADSAVLVGIVIVLYLFTRGSEETAKPSESQASGDGAADGDRNAL